MNISQLVHAKYQFFDWSFWREMFSPEKISRNEIYIHDWHIYNLQDRAGTLGIEKEDASFLLSVVGIANTIGRIILGYISDRSWINRLYLYNVSLAICGICKIHLDTETDAQ